MLYWGRAHRIYNARDHLEGASASLKREVQAESSWEPVTGYLPGHQVQTYLLLLGPPSCCVTPGPSDMPLPQFFLHCPFKRPTLSRTCSGGGHLLDEVMGGMFVLEFLSL